MASNDLDERLIESLKTQGARITVWGVGTKLVTGGDQPAMGGVFKLSALRDAAGRWTPRLKLSEQAAKTSIPGVLQVRRFRSGAGFAGDMIYDETSGTGSPSGMIDPLDTTRHFRLPPAAEHEDLLVPVMRQGRLVGEARSLEAIRRRTQEQLAMLPPGVLRFLNPHEYPVGLEPGLHALRTEPILRARG